MKTAGMWPWKLESFKECVTTHLPNESALKMDGAKCPILIPDRQAILTVLLRAIVRFVE